MLQNKTLRSLQQTFFQTSKQKDIQNNNNIDFEGTGGTKMLTHVWVSGLFSDDVLSLTS